MRCSEIVDPMAKSLVCRVCDITINVRPHFGSITCLACASFFRRTVSLSIQYVCKYQNNCPVSHAVRSGCRACRFQSCGRAGMNKGLVRGKRDINKVPKYVRESINRGDDSIVRDYTTSTFETLHGYQQKCDDDSGRESESSSSESVKSDNEEFFTILNVTSEQLMQYYLEINDRPSVELSEIKLDSLLQFKKNSDQFAAMICQNCPGTDLLEREDLAILFQYCSFSTLWMDALYAEIRSVGSLRLHNSAKSSDSNDMDCEIENDLPSLFQNAITHFRQTVGQSLCHLNLDEFEYAVLKSFCIWKLGTVDFNLTLKIVAQEQYLGMTLALTEYYKTRKDMGQFEIAMKIADMTLLLGPIFNSYRDMLKLQKNLQEFFELRCT